MSKNVCLIPAKGASTRLPMKNVLKINGRELIYYGITAALSSKLFDGEVYVSTELEEIRSVALKYGAKAPYLRAAKLSVDPAGVVQVALDFFERMPEFKSYQNLFIVLPTAPLIQAEDLQKAFETYRSSGTKCLMSVSETEHNAQRSLFVRDNKIVPLSQEGMLKKSQELETTYHINGAVVIIDIKAFLDAETYHLDPTSVYIIPRDRAVDIDTKLDYLWAKFLMESNNGTESN
jgi:pseudaminic acid cytidylyltransferase